jgi:regulation of enolase protein 1 (concanavalin A-like superfamily)
MKVFLKFCFIIAVLWPAAGHAGGVCPNSDFLNNGFIDNSWYINDVIGDLQTTVYENSSLNINTSASNIYGLSDDHYAFVYQAVSGDFDVSVMVNNAPMSDALSAAGIMAAVSLTSQSPRVFAFVTRDNGYSMQYRPSQGAPVSSNHTFAPYTNATPTWLRLKRVGNIFTGYYSSNGGATWTSMNNQNLAAPADMHLGLAVCSNSALPGTSSFNNFTVLLGGGCPPPLTKTSTQTPGLSTASPTITPTPLALPGCAQADTVRFETGRSTHNAKLSISYAAACSFNASGRISVVLPASWPAPQTSAPANQAFVSSSSGNLAISGNTITLTGPALPSQGLVSLVYGAGTQGVDLPDLPGTYMITVLDDPLGLNQWQETLCPVQITLQRPSEPCNDSASAHCQELRRQAQRSESALENADLRMAVPNPVPSGQDLCLILSQGGEGDWQLFSISGALIKQGRFAGGKAWLSTKALAPGIYLAISKPDGGLPKTTKLSILY